MISYLQYPAPSLDRLPFHCVTINIVMTVTENMSISRIVRSGSYVSRIPYIIADWVAFARQQA